MDITDNFLDQPELLTPQLKLRPFKIEDSATIESLAGNVKVARMTLNVPHPYRPGMAKDWISNHKEGWNSKSHINYAVTINTSSALIGSISLVKSNETTADLGYWIGEPYWGTGYCTEAARRLIEFSFDALGYKTITARHLSHNAASGRVMLKAGMKYLKQSDGSGRNNEPAQFKHYYIEAAVG